MNHRSFSEFQNAMRDKDEKRPVNKRPFQIQMEPKISRNHNHIHNRLNAKKEKAIIKQNNKKEKQIYLKKSCNFE